MLYTLVASCEKKGVNPIEYLTDVLMRVQTDSVFQFSIAPDSRGNVHDVLSMGPTRAEVPYRAQHARLPAPRRRPRPGRRRSTRSSATSEAGGAEWPRPVGCQPDAGGRCLHQGFERKRKLAGKEPR